MINRESRGGERRGRRGHRCGLDEPPGSRRGIIATGTAIAIGALASAGASIAAAKIGSSAAKSAAKTQSEAADRAATLNALATRDALQLQREMFERGAATQQPYVALGAGALSRLGAGMGLPPPAADGSGGVRGLATRLGGTPAPAVNPAARPLARLARPPSGFPAAGGATGPVRLQAPDGTEADIPAEQVAHYMARGARRVGTAPQNTSPYA